MTELTFKGFMAYEDGKIACVETTDEEIPVNIFIDNAEEFEDMQEDSPCAVEICGVGSGIKVYASEEDYFMGEGKRMAPVSMIPMGTFPADGDWENFEQSPHILFSGRVLGVAWNPSAEPDDANCDIVVETFGFTFNLYLRYEGPVEPGNIVCGIAWLYGDMYME